MKYKAIQLAIESDKFWIRLEDFKFEFEIDEVIEEFNMYFNFDDLDKNISHNELKGTLTLNSGNIILKNQKLNIQCLCEEDIKKGKTKTIILQNVDIFRKYNSTEVFDVWGSCDKDLILRVL